MNDWILFTNSRFEFMNRGTQIVSFFFKMACLYLVCYSLLPAVRRKSGLSNDNQLLKHRGNPTKKHHIIVRVPIYRISL